MDRAGVLATLCSTVADSLARKPSEVRPESRLTADLGADSLDFVDLVFRIEKRFGIRMRDGGLEFLARLDLSDPAVMREGFLTPETVERLASWLPAVRSLPDPGRVAPADVFSLVTVGTLQEIVERKLREKG